MTVDGRSRARAAAKEVRDLVIRLGGMPDGQAQHSALLEVLGLTEMEVVASKLEERIR